MNLFKWVNVLDKKINVLNVEPNLCVHLISPKSSCSGCVDHCPTKSIAFKDKQIVIDDNCLECGLCGAVCPTNALLFNRPPLKRVISDLITQCKQQDSVYLHCEKVQIQDRNVTAVSVPCLGMIPREAWVTVLNNCSNLSIYHPETSCSGCEITTGEEVWKQVLHAGEKMADTTINITLTINHEENTESYSYDKSRRSFLLNIMNEMKATNKLAFREMVGSPEVLSYQDKLEKDSFSKVKREWEEVSNVIIERVTSESALPYMEKRSIFLAELRDNETLQEQENIRLPVITPDCNFCCACTILCPTEALKMETVNNQPAITLEPSHCVDCSLCEEICFTKSIQLQHTKNKTLLQQKQVLLTS